MVVVALRAAARLLAALHMVPLGQCPLLHRLQRPPLIAAPLPAPPRSLPAAERERIVSQVLQLLADGVITPYAGGWLAAHLQPLLRFVPLACNALLASLQPLASAGGTRPLSPPCCQPTAALWLPFWPPPAGQRFPLEQVAEAVRASNASARGGKVLLEG